MYRWQSFLISACHTIAIAKFHVILHYITWPYHDKMKFYHVISNLWSEIPCALFQTQRPFLNGTTSRVVHLQSPSITCVSYNHPNSKVPGANMGPIWSRQDPGGPHVGPMNFDIWALMSVSLQACHEVPCCHTVIKCGLKMILFAVMEFHYVL